MPKLKISLRNRDNSRTTWPRELKFGIKNILFLLLTLIKFHPDRPYETGENPDFVAGQSSFFHLFGPIFAFSDFGRGYDLLENGSSNRKISFHRPPLKLKDTSPQ